MHAIYPQYILCVLCCHSALSSGFGQSSTVNDSSKYSAITLFPLAFFLHSYHSDGFVCGGGVIFCIVIFFSLA